MYAGHQMLRSIKDKLGSKTTETYDRPVRNRLPPLQSVSGNLAAPSNGATATTLPPIRGTNPVSPPLAPLPPESDNKEAESSFINHSHQNGHTSVNNPPAYATLSHDQNPGGQYQNSQPITQLPPLAANPIPQAGSFQTSESRGYTPPETTVFTINQSDQERRLHIEQYGVRTYPLFAVLTAFFCNPICGVAAALLSLVAADKYYKKRFIVARNTAAVANSLILVALSTGVLMYIGFIIWGSISNSTSS